MPVNQRVLLLLVALAAMPGVAQETPAPLDELLAVQISTAAKYEQRVFEVPASVTIITAEEIERYGYETLTEVLASLRGVYVTYDRNYTGIGVRGFGRPSDYNNRLLILIDGHPLNETVFGSAPGGTDFVVDLDAVQRIEFVRGPGSVQYGTGAVFGVVNVIMKGGESAPRTRVAVKAGSFGRSGLSASLARELGNGTRLAVSATGNVTDGDNLYFPEFDAVETNHGIAAGRDFDRSFGVFSNVSHGPFELLGYFGTRKKGIPTAAFDTDFNADSFTVDQNEFLELRYQKVLAGDSRFTATVSWDRYRYNGDYVYDGEPSRDSATGIWLTAEARWLWNIRSNQRLSVGAEFVDSRHADYGVSGGSSIDPQFGKARVTSLYLEHEYQPRTNVTLVAGLRHDAGWHGHAATTPRLAVIYNPMRDSALKILWGEAYRAPTVYELYYEDDATGTKRAGPLQNESLRNLEVAWEQRLGEDFLFVGTAYRYKVTNLVDRWLDPTDELIQFRNEDGPVESRGAELQLEHRTRSGIWSSLSYAWQRATTGGEWITNSPLNIARARVSMPTDWRVRGALELAWQSGRKTVAGSRTDSALVTDLSFATTLSSRIELSVTVRNLLDERYAHPASLDHRQDSIPQDGRNGLLRVRYTW